MATQQIRQGQVAVSPFETLLSSYGCSPLLMVDSGMSWSQPAVQTPMITGHPRPPGAFDGQFDHIHVPDNPILDNATFSVVCVFSTVVGQRQLCSRWSTVTSHFCWSMDTFGASDKVRWFASDTSAASTTATSTGTAVVDGNKHFAVGTFDVSKIARLYVDADTVVVTSAMSGTPRNIAASANITIGGTRNADVIENNYGDAFVGNIGVFAYLPGVVLSGAQVSALYALL